MPYTYYTRDERNALQAMEDMGLPKCYEAVILGKRPGSIYRELHRNRTGCVYGSEARQAGEHDVWRPSCVSSLMTLR
jgi:IS30 family transposase